MRVNITELRGVRVHEAHVHADRRGNFVKLLDAGDGTVAINQVCTSFNHLAGTLRGMHVQVPPDVEEKLVWCTAGAIWDVLIDARRGESTYGSWAATELRADESRLLQVPPGVAHGYQTLTHGAGVAYLIKGRWVPSAARTIAWDDPALGIAWPKVVTEISDADRSGASWPLS